MLEAIRYHDISCGHRVAGHEGKCQHLHGHNYRIHFHCRASRDVNDLDSIGRVIDFSIIKTLLCMWIEEHWDHKMLMWEQDPMLSHLFVFSDSLVIVPFNPTAENMAHYLLHVISPQQLAGTGIEVHRIEVEETMKCKAGASL